MNDSLQVFAFGDITIEEVAGEIVRSYDSMLGVAEAVTPFSFNDNEFTLPTGNEDNEREEKLCQLFEQGIGVVLCSDYEQTMSGLVRKLIRNVNADNEKHLVVVSGLREELWGLILPALREQNIEPSDCQWLITVNVNSVDRVIDEKNKCIEINIDITDLAEPVVQYISCIGGVDHQGLMGLHLINGNMEEVKSDVEQTQEQGGRLMVVQKGFTKIPKGAKEGYLDENLPVVGSLPFGDVLANGVIVVRNQGLAEQMVKDYIEQDGHLLLVGRNEEMLEKWLLEFTSTSKGIHTLVGYAENLATFYERHEDVPYVPCGLQGHEDVDGYLLEAVNPIKDVSEYVSGLHLKGKQMWELLGLYGEEYVADKLSDVRGILTLSRDVHEGMLDRLMAERSNETLSSEIAGLIEALTLVVNDDGTFEIALPPVSVIGNMIGQLGQG